MLKNIYKKLNGRRKISLLLAIVMVFSMIPIAGITAAAAPVDLQQQLPLQQLPQPPNLQHPQLLLYLQFPLQQRVQLQQQTLRQFLAAIMTILTPATTVI